MTNTEAPATSPLANAAVRDVSTFVGSQSFGITALAHVEVADGTVVVSLKVKVDAYQRQSYATAAVFSAAQGWTVLLDSPSSSWWGDVKGPAAQHALDGALPYLEGMISGLLARTKAVLEFTKI